MVCVWPTFLRTRPPAFLQCWVGLLKSCFNVFFLLRLIWAVWSNQESSVEDLTPIWILRFVCLQQFWLVTDICYLPSEYLNLNQFIHFFVWSYDAYWCVVFCWFHNNFQSLCIRLLHFAGDVYMKDLFFFQLIFFFKLFQFLAWIQNVLLMFSVAQCWKCYIVTVYSALQFLYAYFGLCIVCKQYNFYIC